MALIISVAVHVRYSGNGMLFEENTFWLEESWGGVSLADKAAGDAI